MAGMLGAVRSHTLTQMAVLDPATARSPIVQPRIQNRTGKCFRSDSLLRLLEDFCHSVTPVPTARKSRLSYSWGTDYRHWGHSAVCDIRRQRCHFQRDVALTSRRKLGHGTRIARVLKAGASGRGQPDHVTPSQAEAPPTAVHSAWCLVRSRKRRHISPDV